MPSVEERCSIEAGFLGPGDMEAIMDPINFQTDIGLVWDPVGGLDSFQGAFNGRGASTPVDTVDSAGPPRPSPSPSASPLSPAGTTLDVPGKVTIRPEDQEPLQHYLSTMVQFAKIRSSASDHIYCYIFANMALNHAHLYEALLAWSALHLAHVRSSSTADAEARYQRAVDLLCRDTHAAMHIHVTLSTVWIMLQYELLAAKSVEEFIRLLDYAADVVEDVFQRHHNITSVKEQLGPVGMRMLMWLSAYDRRAAPFGSSCRLLRCLKLHSSIYNIIDGHGQGGSSSPDQAAALIEFGTVELKAFLRINLRLNIFKGSCTLLGRRQHASSASQAAAAWTALHSSLETLQHEAEEASMPSARFALRVATGDMTTPIAINNLEYNWLQLLASFYSSVILYLQTCPQTNTPVPTGSGESESTSDLPSSLWKRRECAVRVIRLSRHAALSRPHCPQAIWPEMLFQAGVEIEDPIYQAWVLETFARAEAWGPNVRKARRLLERIIQVRRDVDPHVDVISLMNDMGGPFVI